MTGPVATLRVERVQPLKTYCTDGITLYRVHLRGEVNFDTIGQGSMSLIASGLAAAKVFTLDREFHLIPAGELEQECKKGDRP